MVSSQHLVSIAIKHLLQNEANSVMLNGMHEGKTSQLPTPLRTQEQIAQEIPEDEKRRKQELTEQLQREKPADADSVVIEPEINQIVDNAPPLIEPIAELKQPIFFKLSLENDSKLAELLGSDPDFVQDTETLIKLKALSLNISASDDERRAAQALLNEKYANFRMFSSSRGSATKIIEARQTEEVKPLINPLWREDLRSAFTGKKDEKVDPEEAAKHQRQSKILERSKPNSNFAHEILGISQTASVDEIKEAYRFLSRRYHPDVLGGDAHKFYRATIAQKTLLESAKSNKPVARQEATSRKNVSDPRQPPSSPAAEGPRAQRHNPDTSLENTTNFNKVKAQIFGVSNSYELPSISSIRFMKISETQRDELIAFAQKQRALFILTAIRSASQAHELVTVSSLDRLAEQKAITLQDLINLTQVVQQKLFTFLSVDIERTEKTYHLPSIISLDAFLDSKRLNQQQFNVLKGKIQAKHFGDLLSTISQGEQSYTLPSINLLDSQLAGEKIDIPQHAELVRLVRLRKSEFLAASIQNASQSYTLPTLHRIESMVESGDLTKQQMLDLASEIDKKKISLK